MKTEILINKLFTLLDEWRNLPAYQLERRADIFFALYLPKIMKQKFGVDIEHIIPEFPVRKGTVNSGEKLEYQNRSFKIDYVAVSEKTNTVYLIELKTDDTSRREKQDQDLNSAKNANITNLIDGVLKICQATSSKKKYENLLSLLSTIGWIDEDLKTNKSHDYDIEIIYIQPNSIQSENTIISFDEIVSFLSKEEDILTKRFVKSLIEWKTNPNR
ncbi:hypothetical protein LJC11_04580 [Bacteroidales bacterium OttesenSCG-928-I21]|nr:hypothetical protein [Bacteroidales bacterium OttesenSCG-928-I21]